jgi:hypothetical protein
MPAGNHCYPFFELADIRFLSDRDLEWESENPES